MVSILGLNRKSLSETVSYGWLNRRSRIVEVVAYTWSVDGLTLSEWTRRHADGDLVVSPEDTIWIPNDRTDALARIASLLGEAAPDVGPRTALLSCPVCGDVACGALTAEVKFREEVVDWRNLGFEGPDGAEPPNLLLCPALTFDRKQYVNTLLAARGAMDQTGH